MAKGVEKKSNLWDDLDPEEIESTDTLTPTDTDTQEQESTGTPTPTKKNKMRATSLPSNKPKKNKSTDTRTHTPRYAPAHLPTVGNGERKTERLQLVVRPSTKSRLANYARDHGTSSNEVVQRLLDNLLDESGY